MIDDLDARLAARIDQLERTVLAMIHVCQALILCAESGSEPEIVRAQHLIDQARQVIGRTH